MKVLQKSSEGFGQEKFKLKVYKVHKVCKVYQGGVDKSL